MTLNIFKITSLPSGCAVALASFASLHLGSKPQEIPTGAERAIESFKKTVPDAKIFLIDDEMVDIRLSAGDNFSALAREYRPRRKTLMEAI